MKTLFLDFETASDVDLRKHGLMRYATDISTRVLMLGWAFGDEPPQLWEPHKDAHMPARVREALDDPAITKVAHNAQFERAIIEDVLGITTPVEQWRCTMVNAYMLALPGALKDLGKVIDLPEEKQKLKTGSALIRRFCMPREPTEKKPWRWSSPYNEPEDWALFCEYCKQDVDAERLAFKKLRKFYVPESEWALWHYDQEINRRGMPIDVEFVEAALALAVEEKKALQDDMRVLTGLRNPSSTAQLLPWLQARGYPFSDLRKERVAKALEDFDRWDQQPPAPVYAPDGEYIDPNTGEKRFHVTSYAPEELKRLESMQARHDSFRPLDEEAKAVLRLHQQASKTSTRKLQAILDQHCDGRLYYQFQFAGAGRTNRWAGRGVQLQNLPRPAKAIEDHLPFIRQLILDRDRATLRAFFGDVMMCLAGSIRSAIKAPHGFEFDVADLASIESRTLGWEARCEPLLEVFRKGKCAYKTFAAQLFNKPYEEVTKGERQIAKPPVLGCGYRLGGGVEVGEYPDTRKTGLLGYAEIYGVKMTPADAREAVAIFRESYPEIVQFWYDLEETAFNAVRGEGPQTVGYLQFDICAPFLRMRLPSGRFVYYLRPRIEKIKQTMPSGDVIEKWSLTYEGYDNKKHWGRIPTHGGRFCEQATQAIARDVLAHGMVEARAADFRLCGTVHDELIAESLWGDGLSAHDLEACMSKVPTWAQGLPLGAEGYTATVYRK